MNKDKQQVHDFWNEASCGENLYLPGLDREAYETQTRKRYELEPYILEFAGFDSTKAMRVLEIGVGLGADHQSYAQAGADLYGIDLTERAVEHTQRRLATFELSSQLAVGDAEQLDFHDEYFDQVYSWGVLHHSPDTSKAVAEVYRVLKRGGGARVMIYHKWSVVGLMLWIRYALLGLRPWLSLTQIYARYLESPGTKAYSVAEARQLFSAFSEVKIHTVLTHGDLLESGAGQRHQGMLLWLARKIWPRAFLKRFFPTLGLFMLIEAKR
ncbi:MAG TPA: class I SAM-dependent methyltransferase [Bacteriovoracaceae bacterium]|nr:class I SAM-dependent methyltransferase [Bacteriovoracaceae bacterium]